MLFRHAISFALFGVAALACDRATAKTTMYSSLSERVVHLAGGDSVEWQATLPVVATDAPPAVLIEFYPFTPPDTAELRRVAIELLPVVVRELPPPVQDVVILRAVSLPTAQRVGKYSLQTFGVVFERRTNGRWYLLHETEPVL
jgi:hypothetical protein